MKTINAKQFTQESVKPWQADKAAKQAKKALQQQRNQRKGKHNIWSNAE